MRPFEAYCRGASVHDNVKLVPPANKKIQPTHPISDQYISPIPEMYGNGAKPTRKHVGSHHTDSVAHATI